MRYFQVGFFLKNFFVLVENVRCEAEFVGASNEFQKDKMAVGRARKGSQKNVRIEYDPHEEA
jgi:hypothetical protein